eukprot:scaffold6150_cov186-Skeletonema_dohrnii-CCMP3373.AAC.2
MFVTLSQDLLLTLRLRLSWLAPSDAFECHSNAFRSPFLPRFQPPKNLRLIFRAGGRVLTFSKEKRGKERGENK